MKRTEATQLAVDLVKTMIENKIVIPNYAKDDEYLKYIADNVDNLAKRIFETGNKKDD